MASRWSPLGLMFLVMACQPRARVVDNDGDGWFSMSDCNDANPLMNPGVAEIPFDFLDNDCNPATLDDDADQDGVLPPFDCEPEDPFVPRADEFVYDGVDNDCDPTTRDDDLDEDGFNRASDCDDQDPTIYPGAPEIPYDGIDNDCSSGSSDDDLDGDGYLNAADCDDLDPEVSQPSVWFPDCDGDGFAGQVPATTQNPWADDRSVGCDPPMLSPCPSGVGSWTTLEPVDLQNDPLNTTADCNDLEPRVHPDQTEFFADPFGAVVAPYDANCDGTSEADFGGWLCIPPPQSGTGSCLLIRPGYTTQNPQCGVELNFSAGCLQNADNSCSMLDPEMLAVACQ